MTSITLSFNGLIIKLKILIMEKWFGASYSSLLAIFLTATGIYLAVIIFTRLAGKRSFSKISSFDFAMTVAIGSLIAATTLSPSTSLIQGIAGVASIYLLQIGAALLRRYEFFQNAIDNTPLLLMDGENILEENLRKARVTKKDLKSKLREANVIKLKQVRAVVFETTGDITVMHSDDPSVQIEDWLLEGVNR